MQRNAGVNVGDGDLKLGRGFLLDKRYWIAITLIRSKIQKEQTPRYVGVVRIQKLDLDDAFLCWKRKRVSALVVWRCLLKFMAVNTQIEQFKVVRKRKRRLSI